MDLHDPATSSGAGIMLEGRSSGDDPRETNRLFKRDTNNDNFVAYSEKFQWLPCDVEFKGDDKLR